MAKSRNNGMLLEMAVELFQMLVADTDITVSRRHILKGGSGKTAEIDILMSGRFGSSEMKVAVECRDRRQPQGTEWIQQIIGKREDLRSFGIRHWIVVSASGFTRPALELAGRAGIELLVRGKATPTNAPAESLSRFMRLTLTYREWAPLTLSATIVHDSDQVADRIERIITEGGWDGVEIVNDDETRLPLLGLIEATAVSALASWRAPSGSSIAEHQMSLPATVATVNDEQFQLENLEATIELSQTAVTPDFQVLTFVTPQLRDALGVIGANVFDTGSRKAYVLVAVKPGNPAQLIGLARYEDGEPMSNVSFEFSERALNEAGFRSRP